jgi:cell division septation protein DedD
MANYEYKVIPAPAKGTKAPGIKAGEARFAHTVEALLNAQAAAGWEYMRSDILPSDERQGLASTQTVYRTLMVFRRMRAEEDNAADEMIAVAQGVAEAVAPAPQKPERREPMAAPIEPSRADPAPKPQTEPDVVPDAPKTPKKD